MSQSETPMQPDRRNYVHLSEGKGMTYLPTNVNSTIGVGGMPPVVPSVDQRRWQVCPVCSGKGIVPHGFYGSAGFGGVAMHTQSERCRSCAGRGIVR